MVRSLEQDVRLWGMTDIIRPDLTAAKAGKAGKAKDGGNRRPKNDLDLFRGHVQTLKLTWTLFYGIYRRFQR